MRITIISPYQFELNRGIERFTYSIANLLALGGNEVFLYTWDNKKKVDWGKWHPLVKIRKVPAFRYFIRIFSALFYKVWLQKDEPDWMLLNFLYHGEEMLPAKYKYIYVLHSPASQVPHRYGFIQQKLLRFKNLQFVAVSDMVAREAEPYLVNSQIKVIPNGVDTNKFKPLNISTKRKDNSIRLISASALEERKGLQFVIKAMGQYSDMDIKYDIFGEGPYEQELLMKIEEHGLNDKVNIRKPVNNIETILPQYDVFCLPSKGEAFALAPIEALSCGVPVLVSKHPPYDELVNGPFGVCVDETDPDEIIKGILQLAMLKQEQPEMIRQAALKYDWKNIVAEYLKVLNA